MDDRSSSRALHLFSKVNSGDMPITQTCARLPAVVSFPRTPVHKRRWPTWQRRTCRRRTRSKPYYISPRTAPWGEASSVCPHFFLLKPGFPLLWLSINFFPHFFFLVVFPRSYSTKSATSLPANYTCYRCGNAGHHIRNCPTSVRGGRKKKTKVSTIQRVPVGSLVAKRLWPAVFDCRTRTPSLPSGWRRAPASRAHSWWRWTTPASKAPCWPTAGATPSLPYTRKAHQE